MNPLPLVSVVIPAYNAQKDLEPCLDSLQKQSYRPIEIIVVDDGSRDKTSRLLKHRRGIKFFTEAHRGPGAARNRGARKAKGRILVFVDADMTFDRRFITNLIKPILTGTAIGTFTKEEVVANPDYYWSKYWSLYRGFASGRLHPADYPNRQKVFRAILKEKFDQAGGFSETAGYTDDWTLSEKLGIEAAAAPGAVIYHRNPQSLGQAFRQAKWMAKRPYKFGIFGRLAALVRLSFPISLLRGLFRSIRLKSAAYLPAHLCLDFAQFIGLSTLFYRKGRWK